MQKYCGPLGLLLACFVCFMSESSGQAIYALKPGVVSRDVSDADLKLPAVTGLTIRVPWSTINPRRGVYDFAEIDQNIAQARRCGNKKVKLLVQTGRDGVSPIWFGGPMYRNVPLPWSPQMLGAYQELMYQLGKQYPGVFAAVHITGPTWPSAEMHPAPNIERVKGYSDAKMVNAWVHAAASVRRAFPNTPLALSISVQKPANRYVDAVILKLRDTLGQNLIVQHNALKANTKLSAPHHALVAKYSRLGVRCGFENACAAHWDPTRFGSEDVNDALEIAQGLGAEFVDVYPPDLEDVK